MEEQVRNRCQQFIENRERIKSVFSWDGGLTHLACAGIYADKGLLVDEKVLKLSKEMIKEKTGVFSNFKGIVKAPIAAMVAVSDHPEQTLDIGLSVHNHLKQEFRGSSYLPLAAMVIGNLAQSTQFEQITTRTRTIYNRMKAEHPFLTSSEDSVFCSLMALSNKSDDVLMEDTEQCYQILKKSFSSANATQSLTHVLALCDGSPEEKCNKTMELFKLLKSLGHKYGTSFELPTLGMLAITNVSPKVIVSDIIDIDQWLSKQKGFGIFGNVTKQQRLMYAGILAKKDDTIMQSAVVSGIVSSIIAQQAAMCAAVTASCAAASSAAASN